MEEWRQEIKDPDVRNAYEGAICLDRDYPKSLREKAREYGLAQEYEQWQTEGATKFYTENVGALNHVRKTDFLALGAAVLGSALAYLGVKNKSWPALKKGGLSLGIGIVIAAVGHIAASLLFVKSFYDKEKVKPEHVDPFLLKLAEKMAPEYKIERSARTEEKGLPEKQFAGAIEPNSIDPTVWAQKTETKVQAR